MKARRNSLFCRRKELVILGLVLSTLILGNVPSTAQYGYYAGINAYISDFASVRLNALNDTVSLGDVDAMRQGDLSRNSALPGPPETAGDGLKLRYLSLVYNEDVRNASLFDDLEMFYRNSSAGLPSNMIPCIVFVNGWECTSYWRRHCENTRKDTGQDQTLLAEAHWPTKANIVGDFEWLEVTHWGLPEGAGYGCFFNVRKGTGIFINTGKTLVVQDDDDAKSIFRRRLNVTAYSRPAEYCPHARKLGYDSVQIAKWVESFSKGGTNQLIYCSGTCETEPVASSCIPGVEFRTGLNHDKACDCDDSLPLLNCGNAIAPKGLQHICDQIQWRDLSVGINASKAATGAVSMSPNSQKSGNLMSRKKNSS